MDRNELHITAIDERHFTDLAAEYVTPMEAKYLESKNEDLAAGAGDGADAAAGGDPSAATAAVDPMSASGDASAAGATGEALTGPGFVIQLTGFHYHNADQSNQTRKFVIDTLVKALEDGTVKLPDGYNETEKKLTGELVDVQLIDMGISRPWLVAGKPLKQEWIDPDAQLMGEGNTSMGVTGFGSLAQPEAAPLGAAGEAVPTGPVSRAFEVKRYDFVVQFCWQPKTRAQRREAAAARLAKEAEEAAAKEQAAADAAAAGGEQPAQ